MPLHLNRDIQNGIINKITFHIDYQKNNDVESGMKLEVYFLFNDHHRPHLIDNEFGNYKIKLVMDDYDFNLVHMNYKLRNLHNSLYYKIIFNTILKDYYNSLEYILNRIQIKSNELLSIELPTNYIQIPLNKYEKDTLLKCIIKERNIHNLINNELLNNCNTNNILSSSEELLKHFTIIDDNHSNINNKLIPLELSNYKFEKNIKNDVFNCIIVIINKYSVLEWESLLKTHKHIKSKIIITNNSLKKELDNFKHYKVICIIDELYTDFYSNALLKKHKYYRLFFENVILYNITFQDIPKIFYKVYIITNNLFHFIYSQYGYTDNILGQYLNIAYYTYTYSFLGKIINKISDIYNCLIKQIMNNENNVDFIKKSYFSKLFINYRMSSNYRLFTKWNIQDNIPELTNYSFEKYQYNYNQEKNIYKNNISLYYLDVKKTYENINDDTLNKLYDKKLFSEILSINKDFKKMTLENKKECEVNEDLKERIEDSCIVCYKDDKKELTLSNCCKCVICLSCSINIKNRNNRCPYCRELPLKVNIINVNFNKNTEITDYKSLATNCKIYNKEIMFNNILNYIKKKNSFSKIIILNVTRYPHFNDRLKNILKNKKINNSSFGYCNSNISFIKEKMNEFKTIGGALFINNIEIFRYYCNQLDADYVINYNYYNSKNISDIKKFFIKNKNVLIFDLVGSLNN